MFAASIMGGTLITIAAQSDKQVKPR